MNRPGASSITLRRTRVSAATAKTPQHNLLDRLEARLGGSWPRRLYAKRGRLYPELLWFSSHVSVLPQFLTFAVELEAVAEEPTFSPVLRVLKREPSGTEWRHARLQLEVARTASAVVA